MRLALALLSLSAIYAQQPNVINARLETHAVGGSLDAEMRRLISASSGPEWVAYAVAAAPGHHGGCNWNSDRGSALRTVRLEGDTTILMLFRIDGHALDKIQTYSLDCELDGGGLPFHLLTGVPATQSLSYLESLAPSKKQAVMAIALHGDPAVDGALERLAATSQPEKVREDVAFWLGSARGARGVQLLKQMLDRDPSERVREKVVFAFSVSKDPSSVTRLIEIARNDRSPEIRGRALFWLAQKAGKKETDAINRAIAEDPDTKVKKQAVFALHQLPRDEGIPLLIQVARTNKNPEVRKQAMFWLGQSKDERALKFFEEVLTK